MSSYFTSFGSLPPDIFTWRVSSYFWRERCNLIVLLCHCLCLSVSVSISLLWIFKMILCLLAFISLSERRGMVTSIVLRERIRLILSYLIYFSLCEFFPPTVPGGFHWIQGDSYSPQLFRPLIILDDFWRAVVWTVSIIVITVIFLFHTFLCFWQDPGIFLLFHFYLFPLSGLLVLWSLLIGFFFCLITKTNLSFSIGLGDQVVFQTLIEIRGYLFHVSFWLLYIPLFLFLTNFNTGSLQYNSIKILSLNIARVLLSILVNFNSTVFSLFSRCFGFVLRVLTACGKAVT